MSKRVRSRFRDIHRPSTVITRTITNLTENVLGHDLKLPKGTPT